MRYIIELTGTNIPPKHQHLSPTTLPLDVTYFYDISSHTYDGL